MVCDYAGLIFTLWGIVCFYSGNVEKKKKSIMSTYYFKLLVLTTDNHTASQVKNSGTDLFSSNYIYSTDVTKLQLEPHISLWGKNRNNPHRFEIWFEEVSFECKFFQESTVPERSFERFIVMMTWKISNAIWSEGKCWHLSCITLKKNLSGLPASMCHSSALILDGWSLMRDCSRGTMTSTV